MALHLADVEADEVHHRGADLIVIGPHGRHGVNRLVLGSDAEQIVRSDPVRCRLPDRRACSMQECVKSFLARI